ncbi:MAG TPA: hypothetical protein V6C95_16690, partial [Coleofasciculaceae cyanobacterium]
MSLIPSSSQNPCPICENINGKCRQGRNDLNYWQCMAYADISKGGIHNGYKCIGHTRDGLWAQFRLDNSQEWSEQQRQEWQRENQRRRQEKARADDKRRRRSLSAVERDHAIRKLHKRFGLSARHKEDLRSKGLNYQQIEALLYFSINPNQGVPAEIPANLPGIVDGKIRAAGTGYACVTFDCEGKATGWQIRLDGATDNKYRWAKGESSSHLANGELPITSVYPGESKHPGIWACEGISKPAIASHRLGIVAIGAA